MQRFDIGGITVKKEDVFLPKLLKELGGEEHVRFITKGNGDYVIKSCYIDENLVDAETSARDIAMATVNNHDKSTASVTADKEIRIAEKKAEMNKDLYDAIITHFNTNDHVAASTWERSWHLKKDNAASYASEGLVSIHTSTSFPTPGTALDTTQKIQDYYGELITERVIPFDKYRDQRVAQFLSEKAAIEAE